MGDEELIDPAIPALFISTKGYIEFVVNKKNVLFEIEIITFETLNFRGS